MMSPFLKTGWPIVAAILFCLAPPGSASPAPWPGDLDPTFDPGSSADGSVHALAVQADGRILVGGWIQTMAGEARKGIARLYPDGALDLSFNPDFVNSGFVSAIEVEPDQTLLLAGWLLWEKAGDFRTGVVRLTPSGNIDDSFVGSTINDAVFAMQVQNDGKILIGGAFTHVNDEPRHGIARLNEDGTLDETFGANLSGIESEFPAGLAPVVRSISIQPDGRILIGGNFRQVHGQPRNRIARLNTDGTLDESFGDGLSGIEFPDLMSYSTESVGAIAIQDDGQILVGGNFRRVNGDERNGIVRLNPNGTTDESFVAGADDWVSAIKVLTDETILVGGLFGSINGEVRNGIARLMPDGTLDSAFGKGQTGADSWIFDIGVDEGENSILIAGIFHHFNGASIKKVARLHGGAAPENTAPSDVLISNDVTSENLPAGAAVAVLTAVDANDRDPHAFVFASGEGDDDNGLFAIEGNALRTATVLDAEERSGYAIRIRTVDSGGFWTERAFNLEVVASLPNAPRPGDLDGSFEAAFIDATVRSAVAQDDGKWIVAGDFTSVAGQPRGRLARLHPDGSLDDSFMDGLPGAGGSVDSAAIQPDGKVLIGGSFALVNGEDHPGYARLNRDGSIDETFWRAFDAHRIPAVAVQTDGKLLIGPTRLNRVGEQEYTFLYPGGVNGLVHTIAVQSDGKIVIGGEFTTVSDEPREGIARLNADGTLDSDFAPEAADGHVYAIALQGDGKMVLGGTFSSVNEMPRNGIARLNADGSIDPAFGDGLTGANGAVRSVAIQRDGRIILGGDFTLVNDVARGRIARLDPDGALDLSFGETSAGADGPVHTVTLQDDGGIVIAGAFDEVNGTPRSRIARLHGGSLPPRELGLNRHAVREHLPPGSTVGTLAVQDHNAGVSHTFELVPGAGDEGNDTFTIEGDTLKTAATFDVESQDSYTIRVRAVNTMGLWVKQVFTIAVEHDHFQIWADQLPDGSRGETDDPGAYGIVNLLRYALDMNALYPERTKLPRPGTTEIESTAYLSLTYTRRTDDSTLTYHIDASDDLWTWEPLANAHEIQNETNGDSETVTILDIEPIADHRKRFLRLRVERW